jgi:putative mRNA 3-end processing factor
MSMIVATTKGLYCPAGDFYIDPWLPVKRAIVTHAHSDHARRSNSQYYCVDRGAGILRYRLGEDLDINAVSYGEVMDFNGVEVSLHPAGHILGSAQVRVRHGGETWVVSGDYKRDPDPTCEPFEVVPCDTFITESTFGLPIYSWTPDAEVFEAINGWWRKNRDEGKASLLLGYSLGKAQRLILGVDSTIGPIYTHGAIEPINEIYRLSGVPIPDTTRVPLAKQKFDYAGALIVAPPAVLGSAWTRRLGAVSTAFASGWMRIRGMRRRHAVDRGFTLSDHADWHSLLRTITETGAKKIFVTHGYSDVLVRYLNERGIDADTMETQFSGEAEETVVEESISAETGLGETTAGEGLNTDE